MEKKFELTETFITVDGTKLYQIRALKDFGKVKAGDLGGFIEKEANLSHGGFHGCGAWIAGNAWVFGDAWISDYVCVTNTYVPTMTVDNYLTTCYN